MSLTYREVMTSLKNTRKFWDCFFGGKKVMYRQEYIIYNILSYIIYNYIIIIIIIYNSTQNYISKSSKLEQLGGCSRVLCLLVICFLCLFYPQSLQLYELTSFSTEIQFTDCVLSLSITSIAAIFLQSMPNHFWAVQVSGKINSKHINFRNNFKCRNQTSGSGFAQHCQMSFQNFVSQ